MPRRTESLPRFTVRRGSTGSCGRYGGQAQVRALPQVEPTPEQLKIVMDYEPGPLVVRGAAGSGKTSTAILRLKFVTRIWQDRVEDGHLAGPVRVLVLTFNRTLRGYIEELTEDQVTGDNITLEIATFGKWSWNLLGRPKIVPDGRLDQVIHRVTPPLGRRTDFLKDEVSYALGRFLPDDLEEYLGCTREGRGQAPQMQRALRERLLDEVVRPYQSYKEAKGLSDWNDLPVRLVLDPLYCDPYHVVIVDEAQDFSTNQLRAVVRYLGAEHSVTFVVDQAQKIYPHHYTWREAGLKIGPRNSVRLAVNHRNTQEIAAFALPLLDGLDIPDDGTMPDFRSCERRGPKPVVVADRFSKQMDYVMEEIATRPDRTKSVAILHPLGGGWFDEVRRRLDAAGMAYVEISRKSDWPTGPENIALCTLSSSKGLEFDHVFIVGVNDQVTPHGDEVGDAQLDNYRRLLAMAIGRARETVMLGYKPSEASTLVTFLDKDTYTGPGP